jgi:hypothetical protein
MPKHGFWNKIIEIASGCWIWRGKLLDNGYAQFNTIVSGAPKKFLVHRYAFEAYYGELPRWEKNGDLELDHLCRNRSCVNPLHLQLVSRKENLERSPLWRENSILAMRAGQSSPRDKAGRHYS